MGFWDTYILIPVEPRSLHTVLTLSLCDPWERLKHSLGYLGAVKLILTNNETGHICLHMGTLHLWLVHTFARTCASTVVNTLHCYPGAHGFILQEGGLNTIVK